MSGKAGVNILIDALPTQMSGKELANFLRLMLGSTIDKIELIINPSSLFLCAGKCRNYQYTFKEKQTEGYKWKCKYCIYP